MHGTYFGLSPEPLVAFDVFRITDGRIAEQWQALQPVITQTASGRTMIDGHAEVTEPEKTAKNEAIVERFVDEVLVRGEFSGLTALLPRYRRYPVPRPACGGRPAAGSRGCRHLGRLCC
jgi:hypothetical protein